MVDRAISDVCLLVRDLGGAIAFYRDRVGFRLRRRAPGFADFSTGGVTLALWQVEHMQSGLGLPPGQGSRGGGSGGGWRSMLAIAVESRDAVESMRKELSARGVPFVAGPQAYSWNAYACYFTDPEENLWEIYTWLEGGHANLVCQGEEGNS